MMKDISMKVNPLYSEVDLSIQFHFEFIVGDSKIGEAMVSTYSIPNGNETHRQSHSVSFVKSEKCAVIDRFEVINDTEQGCMKKLCHFLGVIGIKEIHSGYDINRVI
jgi:hypothetical protein